MKKVTDKNHALVIKCDKCSGIMKQPGALIFSPPVLMTIPTNEVLKFHVCRACYSSLVNWLEREGD